MKPLPQNEPSPSIAALLANLEAISRTRPDRVLRLRGELPVEPEGAALGEAVGRPEAAASWEPFELLIFRGFSSSTTHPTAFDPDRAALPDHARIKAATLLAGPLTPGSETVLAGPGPVAEYLHAGAWGQALPAGEE